MLQRQQYKVEICSYNYTVAAFSFLVYYLLCILQAVWAGWGHASEYPKLPELLHKNAITFIGKGDVFLCVNFRL